MLEKRKMDLFNFVVDYRFGSIWRICENFWEKNIPHFHSSKKWHPGFSIYCNQRKGYFPFLPVLFGTSSLFGYGFCVKGLTRERGPEYKTWFGEIEKTIPKASPEDFFGESPDISRNEDKPWASQEEMNDARRFLRRQNVCGGDRDVQ